MRFIIVFIAALVLVSCASALPTTNAATDVGNNNFTLHGSGITGTSGWFQWGLGEGQSWAHTPNRTATAGSISYTMRGSPITGCTTFYYRACDTTGCGSEISLMTLEVTPLPHTTFGDFALNITENAFEPQNAFWNAMRPYTSVTTDTIFYGIIFMMVIIGIWLRTRGTAVATMFGVILAGLFASSAVALQLGLPPEFLAVGQAMLYLSLTGAVMMFTFK